MAFKFNPLTGQLDLVGSGGGGSITLQPDVGTSPVGTTFDFTSADENIVITGNSGTDELEFSLANDIDVGGVITAGGVSLPGGSLGVGAIDLEDGSNPGSIIAGIAADISSGLVLSANPNVNIVLSTSGTGVINASGVKVVSAADPTAAQDVATKNYVDTGRGISRKLIMRDDFVGGFYGSGIVGSTSTLFAQQAAGGSATGYRDGGAASTAANPGVLELFTAADASDIAFMCNGTGGLQPLKIGAGAVFFETIMRASANLSAAGENYGICAGLGDAAATYKTMTNGIYISYNHAVNSGNWTGNSSKAGVHSTVDLGTAASVATYHRLGFMVNSAFTSIQFYVNGVAAGSPITTNILLSSATVRLLWFVQKAAGSAARSCFIDAYYLEIDVTR